MTRHPGPPPAKRPGIPAWIATSATPAPANPGAAFPRTARATLSTSGLRTSTPVGVGLDSATVRMRMVQKLAAAGIQSPVVLQALGTVERHRFVDSALVNQAYEDTSLPIGLQQTISKPSVVARMIELLLAAECVTCQGGRLGKVLEIGTGCGYQAAVLAHIAQEVHSIERLRGLHDKAQHNLRPLQLNNLHLLFGDGMQGHAQAAPYAGIIAAAGGETVPPAWLEQLATGGRLVAPLARSNGQQVLLVVDKTATGYTESILEAVHFVPLKSGIA